jgi:hypothetical protein
MFAIKGLGLRAFEIIFNMMLDTYPFSANNARHLAT